LDRRDQKRRRNKADRRALVTLPQRKARMADAYNLQRFVDAQAPVYARALAELKRGAKQTHWMWFIFPQIAGLGSSLTAQFYAIGSLAEARAYLAHPVLGPRLVECTTAVNAVAGRSAHAIFGSPDDFKFRSSLTLFREAAPDEPAFGQALSSYFGGEPDPKTRQLLGR
jgi:uncharacterized protein (DUF1810 family)